MVGAGGSQVNCISRELDTAKNVISSGAPVGAGEIQSLLNTELPLFCDEIINFYANNLLRNNSHTTLPLTMCF